MSLKWLVVVNELMFSSCCHFIKTQLTLCFLFVIVVYLKRSPNSGHHQCSSMLQSCWWHCWCVMSHNHGSFISGIFSKLSTLFTWIHIRASLLLADNTSVICRASSSQSVFFVFNILVRIFLFFSKFLINADLLLLWFLLLNIFLILYNMVVILVAPFTVTSNGNSWYLLL